MKKSITVVLGAAILGMGAFNVLSVNVSESSSASSLKNLSALQSAAAEMYCDQTNSTTCSISSGGVTGTSKGFLIYRW